MLVMQMSDMKKGDAKKFRLAKIAYRRMRHAGNTGYYESAKSKWRFDPGRHRIFHDPPLL